MTLAVVATPAAADANSYITLAEAEAYVATLVHSDTWTGKTDEQKKAAIISATRTLDTLRWSGMRTTEAQALAWPRCSATNAPFDGTTTASLVDADGYEVSASTIPACVKTATAELALRLAGEDRTADAGALVPAHLQVGSLTVDALRAQIIPAYVRALVRAFLAPSGCIPVVRG